MPLKNRTRLSYTTNQPVLDRMPPQLIIDVYPLFFVFRSLFSNALLKLSAGSSKFSTSEVPTVGFSDITTKSELILTLENFFMNWKCTDYTVLACLQELGRNLHENKLISQENLQLMQMWVSDLISIGYKNTPVIPNEILPHEPCIGEYILIFFFKSI